MTRLDWSFVGGGDLGHADAGVVFDLWGTLVPFRAALWDKALAEIASVLGASLDDFVAVWRAGYAKRAVGDLESNLRSVCRTVGVTIDEARIQQALEIRRAAHAAMFVPRLEAAPALRRLRTLGYRIGLLTNCTSEVPQLWQECPLAPLVDATVFSCVERLKKPDPVIYALAAARLGTETSRCVFVGDGADNELSGASAAQRSTVMSSRTAWEMLPAGLLPPLVAAQAASRDLVQRTADRPANEPPPGGGLRHDLVRRSRRRPGLEASYPGQPAPGSLPAAVRVAGQRRVHRPGRLVAVGGGPLGPSSTDVDDGFQIWSAGSRR